MHTKYNILYNYYIRFMYKELEVDSFGVLSPIIVELKPVYVTAFVPIMLADGCQPEYMLIQ